MHCRSCELILEKSLKKIENIHSIHANEKKWIVEIHYIDSEPDRATIESIIRENGYQIGEKKKLPWITHNLNDYIHIGVALWIALLLYEILTHFGWSFWSVGNTASPTLGVAFLIGLTAGVSSCMALIGWLVLGVSANWNKEHAHASLWRRFSPHLYFHLGRIVGFWILWGILWFFGSMIHFSNIFLGGMTILVGIVMLVLGLNLTNLSPRIGSFSPTLPKFLGKNIKWDGNTKISTLITGAATFFLPCGFTLAMQVYAVSTGSFLTWALVMAFFALGTVPGLLSLGFISAVLRGEWLKRFFVFTGVIVLGLWIFNFNNGYALLSLGVPAKKSLQSTDTSNLEVQEVHMTQDGNGYTPSTFSIDAGKKIRWIITGTNPYACSSQIMVPSLGISKELKQWENIIEFVAPESGEIPFSCSMGMYTGKFIITPSAQNTPSLWANIPASIPTQKTPVQWGECAMMGGTRSQSSTASTWSTIIPATAKNIDMTYTQSGLTPREITIKKDQTYTITLQVIDTISGCMHMILIPWLDENAQPLDAGNTVKFTITPKESGRFPLTCAMGVPHGYINVE